MYLVQMIKMYFLLALFTLIATAESQKYQQQQQDGNNDAGSGERVDKLASASGDLYWRPQQILSPPDWYQNALMNKLQEQQQQQQQQQQLDTATGLEDPFARSQYQIIGAYDGSSQFVAPPPNTIQGLRVLSRPDKRQAIYNAPISSLQYIPLDSSPIGGGSESRNYRALVNDFKQYSHLSNNPSRESRAFKPKIMSTARGFGKRSMNSVGHSVSYADLLAAADPNGPISTNGKMSGNAIR